MFDSGLGGLSVLRELRAQLPHEDFLYVADSGHVPYGEKSDAFIRARTLAIAGFLLERRAKLLVVACNTATAAAVRELRAGCPVPVVGMEPAVKPAAAATRSGTVGVLATTGTLASAKFAALLARFGRDVRVLTEPCPGWVDLVERGDCSGPAARAAVARHVEPLLAQGADTLILGCTHYPFLKPLIAEVAGPGVALIDTGAAVARHTRAVLTAEGRLAPGPRPGSEAFFTSGEPARLGPVLARLRGTAARLDALPAAVARA
ncbi:MAG TPA: glutamate racemase [Plasticicumulans sp.]|uniref:glutamate racemase n=3 Tax=Plasticicumulans sp. TaxID=2307179 RepID=UPI002D06F6F7|nr:glutamate racemase [Plasticicumulans sp.]HMW30146.1 glutamate racemase [Plasticicumulans sp.]HNF65122.1 glutamate racemase [Plasticicumulans sp.]